MITLTILGIILLLIIGVVLLVTGIVGTGFVLIFGDLIIAILIIALFVKLMKWLFSLGRKK